MTHRSFSLSRVMWWAGLVTLVVALMPFTLRGHARAEEESNVYGFKHCDARGLQGKTCGDPGQCINACANKCTESYLSCKQCCAAFSVHGESYWSCMDLCSWTWSPIPQP